MLSCFTKCSHPGCPELCSYPLAKLCTKHYQQEYYLKRRARLFACDPVKVHKAVASALLAVRDLRAAGMLSATEAVFYMARFNQVPQQLNATIGTDDEAVEMAQADEEYTKMLLRRGGVEAESEEQAKKLMEEQATKLLE
jgi:hypothetical protein